MLCDWRAQGKAGPLGLGCRDDRRGNRSEEKAAYDGEWEAWSFQFPQRLDPRA